LSDGRRYKDEQYHKTIPNILLFFLTNVLDKSSIVEDIQIDAMQFKPLTEQKKRHWHTEGLCLYCGEPRHKVDGCPNKWQREPWVRSANIEQKNNNI